MAVGRNPPSPAERQLARVATGGRLRLGRQHGLGQRLSALPPLLVNLVPRHGLLGLSDTFAEWSERPKFRHSERSEET